MQCVARAGGRRKRKSRPSWSKWRDRKLAQTRSSHRDDAVADEFGWTFADYALDSPSRTVSRTFTKLDRDGVIEIVQGGIRLADCVAQRGSSGRCLESGAAAVFYPCKFDRRQRPLLLVRHTRGEIKRRWLCLSIQCWFPWPWSRCSWSFLPVRWLGVSANLSRCSRRWPIATRKNRSYFDRLYLAAVAGVGAVLRSGRFGGDVPLKFDLDQFIGGGIGIDGDGYRSRGAPK